MVRDLRESGVDSNEDRRQLKVVPRSLGRSRYQSWADRSICELSCQRFIRKSRAGVSGHYSIEARDEVAFHVDPYDHTRSLVIDPTILYSTLLGGGLSSSTGQAIAVDSAGNILVAGNTYAADFPTVHAFQSGLRGSSGNGFVAKINAAGTALIYSTYIGGSNYNSFSSIAVDSAGSAWVTGYTFATDFPVLNPVQSANAGSYDAVVVKLSANGALQFSTYLGGRSYDEAYGIAVDTFRKRLRDRLHPRPISDDIRHDSNTVPIV